MFFCTWHLHQRVVYDMYVYFCRLSQYVESIQLLEYLQELETIELQVAKALKAATARGAGSLGHPFLVSRGHLKMPIWWSFFELNTSHLWYQNVPVYGFIDRWMVVCQWNPTKMIFRFRIFLKHWPDTICLVAKKLKIKRRHVCPLCCQEWLLATRIFYLRTHLYIDWESGNLVM